METNIAACACVGIRTCLLCEDRKNKILSNTKLDNTFQEFLYHADTEEAVVYGSNGLPETKKVNFPGVFICKDFISSEEESTLIEAIDAGPWKASQSGRYKQDFGPKVNFKKRKVKHSCFNGLPSYIKPFVARMSNLKRLCDFKPVELCNLDYAPERGSAIDAHFDDTWLWGERLVSLNLLSSTYLTMTRDVSDPDNNIMHPELDDTIVKVPLERRSLVVLFGEARHCWKHGILRGDIKARRVCCTLRELSDEFLMGKEKPKGDMLLDIANSYAGTAVG